MFGKKRQRSASLGQFRRRQRGSSAIEFALMVPPFLFSMFSTFEVGWFYFVRSTVDASTIGISRLIRTGQIQGDEDFDVAEFLEEQVCPQFAIFGSCDEVVTAEVVVFDSFEALAQDISPMTCRDAPPEDVDGITVDPGTENDIIRVRICLIYKTLNPVVGISLASTDDGNRRVTSTYIFRNEPYLQNVNSAS